MDARLFHDGVRLDRAERQWDRSTVLIGIVRFVSTYRQQGMQDRFQRLAAIRIALGEFMNVGTISRIQSLSEFINGIGERHTHGRSGGWLVVHVSAS
jgi:hypothetical protein